MRLALLLLFPFILSLLDVPFVRQKDDFCGPASLSSVLKFYGTDIDQEEIAKEIYSPTLKGTLIIDLKRYAQSLGFKSDVRRGSLEELKSYINRGYPVIVLVDLGKFFVSAPHYMVVVGYDEEHIVAHTGYKANQRLSYEDFNRIWSKMGNVMLVLHPKNHIE